MKANVCISNIYWNKGLSGFFFREQAMKTLEELVKLRSCSGDDFLNALDEATEDMEIDDVEEMFYDMSMTQVAEELGIEDLIK